MQYTAKLLRREIISSDIMVLYFEKPKGFSFRAGQFCLLRLPDIGFRDEIGLQRYFSIASSPLEEELVFATKTSGSAFKKTLGAMSTETEAAVEEPVGLFVLPDSPSVHLIFLAAGIGITPFRSMIRYISDLPTKHVTTLFYSNRTPEEAIFLRELREIADTHKNISLLATMTRVQEASTAWTGLKGRISPSMIRAGCGEWQHALYYVAGPPAMVQNMLGILEELGINTDKILTERFAGYEKQGIQRPE